MPEKDPHSMQRDIAKNRGDREKTVFVSTSRIVLAKKSNPNREHITLRIGTANTPLIESSDDSTKLPTWIDPDDREGLITQRKKFQKLPGFKQLSPLLQDQLLYEALGLRPEKISQGLEIPIDEVQLRRQDAHDMLKKERSIAERAQSVSSKNTLSPILQEPLDLLNQGLSTKEIALRLDIPERIVSSRIYSARAKKKKQKAIDEGTYQPPSPERITIMDSAKESGFGRTTILKIKKGDPSITEPTLALFKKAAIALGMPAEEIRAIEMKIRKEDLRPHKRSPVSVMELQRKSGLSKTTIREIRNGKPVSTPILERYKQARLLLFAQLELPVSDDIRHAGELYEAIITKLSLGDENVMKEIETSIATVEGNEPLALEEFRSGFDPRPDLELIALKLPEYFEPHAEEPPEFSEFKALIRGMVQLDSSI